MKDEDAFLTLKVKSGIYFQVYLVFFGFKKHIYTMTNRFLHFIF